MTEVSSSVDHATVAMVQRNGKGQIIPGQTGGLNPRGRPRGSRSKLGEAFVADLYDHWQEHGASVIERVATERPDAYLRVIAQILPKDVNINVQSLDDLSDDQLMRKLQVLTEMAKPLLAKLNSIEATAVDVTPQDVVVSQGKP